MIPPPDEEEQKDETYSRTAVVIALVCNMLAFFTLFVSFFSPFWMYQRIYQIDQGLLARCPAGRFACIWIGEDDFAWEKSLPGKKLLFIFVKLSCHTIIQYCYIIAQPTPKHLDLYTKRSFLLCLVRAFILTIVTVYVFWIGWYKATQGLFGVGTLCVLASFFVYCFHLCFGACRNSASKIALAVGGVHTLGCKFTHNFICYILKLAKI